VSAKDKRQTEIRRIVRTARPATQAELAALLGEQGFDVTQTTVSRDLTDLGLRKAPDGRYELAEDLHLKRMCADLVQSVERSANLIIVKTFAGTAEGVGAALDAAAHDGVLGCVAGDDTLLVVTRDAGAAEAVTIMLRTYSRKDS